VVARPTGDAEAGVAINIFLVRRKLGLFPRGCALVA